MPRIHLQQRGRRAGNEWRHRRRRHLGHFGQQLDIWRALVKMVVTYQAAKRLTAKLAVFLFINFLEERALVPIGAFVALQGFAQLGLGDVHHPNLELLVGLGVVDHVMQAAPGTFELLEVLMVQNLIDLVRQFFVDCRNHVFNGFDDVFADQLGLRQRLLGQRLHRFFNGAFRFVRLRFELLLQQGCEVAALKGHTGQRGSALCLSHQFLLDLIVVGSEVGYLLASSAGLAELAKEPSSAGSANTLATSSSAPPLPSM